MPKSCNAIAGSGCIASGLLGSLDYILSSYSTFAVFRGKSVWVFCGCRFECCESVSIVHTCSLCERGLRDCASFRAHCELCGVSVP